MKALQQQEEIGISGDACYHAHVVNALVRIVSKVETNKHSLKSGRSSMYQIISESQAKNSGPIDTEEAKLKPERAMEFFVWQK